MGLLVFIVIPPFVGKESSSMAINSPFSMMVSSSTIFRSIIEPSCWLQLVLFPNLPTCKMQKSWRPYNFWPSPSSSFNLFIHALAALDRTSPGATSCWLTNSWNHLPSECQEQWGTLATFVETKSNVLPFWWDFEHVYVCFSIFLLFFSFGDCDPPSLCHR